MSAEWAGRDPRLAALHRLWRQKEEERSWPARRDFRHDDLRPWFGSLYLFDVLREPLDFRCRLFGTRLVEALRGDLTNKLLSQAPELIGLTQPEEGGAAADFRNCVRTREPRWHHGYWPVAPAVERRHDR